MSLKIVLVIFILGFSAQIYAHSHPHPYEIYSFKKLQSTTELNFTIQKIDTTFQNKSILGNFVKIFNDASQIFSIEIPEGVCKNRSTTKYTSEYRKCEIATNAGFFDMSNGDCEGNVVTNGNIIQTDFSVNACNFGLLKNGSFFIGFLNQTIFSSLSFSQLVSGRGWLVKDGKSYITTAAPIEGISSGFITEIAPRIAIGFDSEGNLQILEINGYEGLKQGIGLDTLADLAVSYNFTEAMNMDGGGSTTLIVDDAVENTCSDGCEKGYNDQYECDAPKGVSSSVCERKVTSITCFKSPSELKHLQNLFLNKFI